MALSNWAGSHTYRAARVHAPATLDELRALLATVPRIRVLGTRHTFTAVGDGDELVRLDALPAPIEVDAASSTVRCGGATTYGELARALDGHGLALQNLASLPHIAVAGAIATATHGSGDGNGNLATAVTELELLTADGELRRHTEPVSVGALGVITRITLAVEPAYEVRQRVFEGLSWDALYEHFGAIMAAAYSVSVFTRWRDDVDMVWLKDRGEPRGELFDARPATVDRHPIMELDAVSCTAQLGVPEAALRKKESRSCDCRDHEHHRQQKLHPEASAISRSHRLHGKSTWAVWPFFRSTGFSRVVLLLTHALSV